MLGKIEVPGGSAQTQTKICRARSWRGVRGADAHLTGAPPIRQPRVWAVLLTGGALLVASFSGCGGSTAGDTGQTSPTNGGASGSAGAGAGADPGGVGGAAGANPNAGFAGAGGDIVAGGGPGNAGAGGTVGSGGQAAIDCAASCDGCCDGTGTCLAGSAINACGRDGARCTRCDVLGFACQNGACAGVAPPCEATCDGCCDAEGLCRLGTQSDACGPAGAACSDCGKNGQSCGATRACEATPPPACSAANCGGCCDAKGTCLPGGTDGACGEAGSACVACGPGEACSKIGHACSAPLVCTSATCPAGCCDAKGACLPGSTNKACGDNGGACADCTATSESCAPQGFCFQGTHCGPDNCAGCCTLLGECKDGATAAACGQFGGTCDACTGSETCDGFVCSSGGVCPSAYAGCSPNALTVPPKRSAACGSDDLAALTSACTGAGSGCGPAFEKLGKSNAACYGCLLPFTTDDAYPRCLSSFVAADCNHELTCAIQCQASCDTCDENKKDACVEAAYAKGGACTDHVYGYFCSLTALGGAGALCEFGPTDDFGSWLARVGGAFCGAP
jgi:hypothetical protein